MVRFIRPSGTVRLIGRMLSILQLHRGCSWHHPSSQRVAYQLVRKPHLRMQKGAISTLRRAKFGQALTRRRN